MTERYDVNTTAPAERHPFNAQGTLPQRAIIIVDDDPQIALALGQWVELQGVTAVCFSCGECLLKALLPELLPLTVEIDGDPLHRCVVVAAILDLNLPGLSGLGLAQLLRVRDANLPLVIVTALREHERRRYGVLPPGVACLQKPFDLDALEDVFAPVLNRSACQMDLPTRV